MRVLQINAVSVYGSTGRNIIEIADFLADLKHECLISAPTGILREKDYKIGTNMDRKIHGLLSRISGLQAYFSRNSTRNLLKYINENKPDIIHLNNLHSNYINLKMLLEYISDNDIATVITLHDCWFYTGKCCHYTVSNCYKWKDGCFECPRLMRDNPSWFFDQTKKMWEDKKNLFACVPRLAVVGVSDWITNEAKESYLSSANIVTRIYNWIDLTIFKPVNALGLRKDLHLESKFVILGVATDWSNDKGLNRFIELAGQIKSNMVIILVGNIAGKPSLPINIIHITKTNSMKELSEYYSLADVFLNLSPEETFGKVSAESLACGTPIITCNSTANTELVGNGCGYVIADHSVENVWKAVQNIYKIGKPYYTKACTNFAKNNFNKDERIEDYIDLYMELLKYKIRRNA